MSYSIEYNKFIYKWKNEEGITNYLLAIRMGDNNVYDHNGVRAKEWYVDFVGTYNELWERIGQLAGCTVGGNIQKHLGGVQTRYFEIPEYVAGYRSKIKNARPLSRFLDDFSIDLVEHYKLSRDDKDTAGRRKEIAEELMKNNHKILGEFPITNTTGYFSDLNLIVRISSIEDLERILLVRKEKYKNNEIPRGSVSFHLLKRGR